MASGAGFRQTTKTFPELTMAMREMGPGVNTKLLRYLKWATIGSTIHTVSNCEDVTDWDIENASYFNAVNETTDIRGGGSNAIELVDAGTTKGTCVTLDEAHRPKDEDWSEFGWLCIWIHDDTAARTAGELTIQIRNNGNWSAEVAVPVVVTADMYELHCIDITDLDRAHVDGFRFVNQRGTGSDEKVYVDEIFVTDLITGVGDGAAIGTGPVIGPCIPMRVQTGSTIVPGDCVEIAGPMIVATGTANDARIVGIACQTLEQEGSQVSSDTAIKEILVAISPALVVLRNDASGMAIGEPGLLGSDVVTEAAGTATDNAEYAFCISMEASSTTAWASGDSLYKLLATGTED